MEFRGRPITVATLSPFMVDPEYGGEPVGSRLIEKAFSGAQDLSWTDGASGHLRAGFVAHGGHAGLYAFNWIRILRPFGTTRIGLDRAGHLGPHRATRCPVLQAAPAAAARLGVLP
ncbi:MAG: hypothetical protein ACLQKA_09690 [Bryobacteraceae bacterium]